MIVTRRRLNIAQAYKIAGDDWVSMEKLMASGCYGTKRSIHTAIRKMALKHDAAAILTARDTADGRTHTIYRVTPLGMAKLGMVPEKKEARQ